MTVRAPRPLVRGDHLTASRLNEPIHAIRALIGGPGATDVPGVAAGAVIQHFEITRVEKDYLVCIAINAASKAETKGTVDVNVAKDYLLRGSLATRNGINYVYTVLPGHTERTGTRVSDSATETQVVVPSYSVGDRVFAFRPVSGGTGVFVADVPVRYLDLSPRAWAKKST